MVCCLDLLGRGRLGGHMGMNKCMILQLLILYCSTLKGEAQTALVKDPVRTAQ